MAKEQKLEQAFEQDFGAQNESVNELLGISEKKQTVDNSIEVSEPVIPGVVREAFPYKGEIRYSYHIEFQRGKNDKFKLDLQPPPKGKDADVGAYREVDGLEIDWSKPVAAQKVFVDRSNNVILPTSDKEKVEARVAVKITATKIVMGEEFHTSALLIPRAREHFVALDEYFKAKSLILQKHKQQSKS